jgi:serine/threonine-protein kinase
VVDGSASPTSRRATEPQLASDTVLDGKYELRGVLGEGGTGIVYDAVRLADGAAVALKVMHARLAGDLQIRGRFQREAVILKRLEGEHICPILELGEVPAPGGGDTLLYMALPKLVGPTLERVLVLERPIDVARGLEVMLEVCDALRVAHGQGVIHRDLKPANVILASGKRAVVVDFGMSKIVTGAASGTTNLTAHNMLFGTPEYMSPEQARGDDLDVRCDVYAVGVMLYELLTGALPFTGPTPLSVLTEHLTGVIVPPGQRAPEGRVTPALEAVALHALARDRDARYASAAALGAAIRHARARPDDVPSVAPAAFIASLTGADAFAQTQPDIVASALSSAPASLGSSRDTLLDSGPPPARSPRAPSGPTGGAPSRSPGSAAPAGPAPVVADDRRVWLALWVLAGLLSIGVGVYLALR